MDKDPDFATVTAAYNEAVNELIASGQLATDEEIRYIEMMLAQIDE